MSEKWIQRAIKHKGAFRRKAAAAGQTTAAYARMVLKKDSRASTQTKRQAVLAQRLRKMH